MSVDMSEHSINDPPNGFKPHIRTPRARQAIRRMRESDEDRFNVKNVNTPNIVSQSINSTYKVVGYVEENEVSDDDIDLSRTSSEKEESRLGRQSFQHSFNSRNSSFNNSDSFDRKERTKLNGSISANNTSKSNEKPFSIFFATSIIISIIIYFCVTVYCRPDPEKVSNLKDEDKFLKAEKLDAVLNQLIEMVKKRFTNQRPDIWNDISSGIYDILLYPDKPTVITLFGNETDTMNCLAKLLGQISSRILESPEHLTLTPADFGTNLGKVIFNLKHQIIEKKVLVIQDLLHINTEAIKAFHNMCDRVNPLVKEAIYIITIAVNGHNSGTMQKDLQFIEGQIVNSLSGKIDDDILNPLITRITDGAIIPVQPESNIAKCSLLL